MTLAINYCLRALCLLVYAMALGQLVGLVPAGTFDRAPTLALVLLALHAGELLLFFKNVRLYPGPLAMSVVLTLLFGLLHWKPLAAQHAEKGQTGEHE
ncbi:MAG: hypothetical protein AAB176_14880 [Pseudomonadota bacterium]|jgi:hypothetical protein